MTKSNKQTNVKLLQIFSVILMVMFSMLTKTGIVSSMQIATPKYYVIMGIEAITYIGGSLFALCTGYLLKEEKTTLKKVLQTWGKVLFYSLGIYAVFLALGIAKHSLLEIYRNITPILSIQSSFVTAYIFVCILAPFLNKMVDNISRKESNILMFAILCICAALNVPGNVFRNNVTMCIIMYVIGAIIKKQEYKVESKEAISYFLELLCGVCLVTFALLHIYTNVAQLESVLFKTQMVFSETSVFAMIMSVTVFFAVQNINITSEKISKGIALVSSLAFGVYVIVENKYISNMLWQNIFKNIQNQNLLYTLLSIFSIPFVIFGIFALVEYARKKLFAKTKLTDFLADKITRGVDSYLG